MFFLVFFLFNPWGWNVLGSERLVYSWCHIDWRNTKSTSTKLHKWSENMVNVENCQFLKDNYEFLVDIWVIWKQSVCSILVLFTACFYHFLFRRYLNSSMTKLFVRLLLPFPNLNDLNSRDISACMMGLESFCTLCPEV